MGIKLKKFYKFYNKNYCREKMPPIEKKIIQSF